MHPLTTLLTLVLTALTSAAPQSPSLHRRQAAASELSSLAALKPTASPTALAQIPTTLSSIFAPASASSTPPSFLGSAAALIENGFAPSNLANVISGLSVGANSPVNVNLRQPATKIYPKKEKDDAPYSLSEAEMRAQIHIPSGFTYGKVQPIIMVPGMFGVLSRH